jgi:hypothetical protein
VPAATAGGGLPILGACLSNVNTLLVGRLRRQKPLGQSARASAPTRSSFGHCSDELLARSASVGDRAPVKTASNRTGGL